MCIMKFWKCVSAYAKNKLIYKYQHWDKMSDIMNELVWVNNSRLMEIREVCQIHI